MVNPLGFTFRNIVLTGSLIQQKGESEMTYELFSLRFSESWCSNTNWVNTGRIIG